MSDLKTTLITVALLSAVLPVRIGGEEPARAILIETARLEKKLASAKLRIIDTRLREDYENGHIPGAIRVDVRKWADLAHADGGFQNIQAWAAEVGKLGIDGKTPVVVYGARLTNVARVWWTFKYLGVQDVRVVDAGWAAWRKEKRPVEKKTPTVREVTFKPRLQKDRLAEIAAVNKAIDDKDTIIIDVRSDDEFTGKVARGPRGGHIPGAVHLEWTRLVTDDGRLKKPQEIAKIFEKHGIVRGKALVPY